MEAFHLAEAAERRQSGKGDAYVAIESAKRHQWKLLMHLWCTHQWLCKSGSDDGSGQMYFFEIHCFYLSLFK